MPKVKEILRKVKRLEIKTNGPVEGLIAGSYHSVFKGLGIEFSEVREYVPGDDIRSIDWNVTARFDAPSVKEFIEERDLNVYIVFDVSASNDFGCLKTKKDAGFEVAASIMFAALRNNDNIGLCLFTDQVERFIKPRKGRKFVLRLLRELIYFNPGSKGTDLNNVLIHLNRIIKRRSIIFIVSDFFSSGFEKPLKSLKNKHDVVLINLSDTCEADLPDVGYLLLEDEESGEQILVDTSDKVFRESYLHRVEKENLDLLNKMKKLKIDVVPVNTSEPFHVPLRRFFSMRQRRQVR